MESLTAFYINIFTIFSGNMVLMLLAGLFFRAGFIQSYSHIFLIGIFIPFFFSPFIKTFV